MTNMDTIGDALLVRVAARLRECIRRSDIVGRFDPVRWAADLANAIVGWVAPVRRCPVDGCPHAQGAFRLCEDNRRRFTRMGMAGASTDEYVATGPPVIVRADAELCGFPDC